jgi:hypothetical protein
MNDIFDKVTDIIDNIAKKNNKLNETIFEKTGMKINAGLIIGGILLVIVVLIFVKAILGFLYSKLV